MKLIVGLGNPGNDYKNTRHNIGFMVIDKICDKLNIVLDKEKFNGIWIKTKYKNEEVIFCKPLTYMNNSGECVRKLVDFFNIDLKDIIVIFDDKEINLGKLRLREKGSSGGQNGMKSIINHLNSDQIKRIRCGVGKESKMDAASFVLSKFSKDELDLLEKVVDKASDGALACLENNFSVVMNKYNGDI